MIAYTGRKMKLADFSLPVVVDLDGLEIPKQNVVLLLQHKLSQIVGLTMKVEIVNHALTAVGVVDDGLPSGHDVWRSGLLGFPWRASIGATRYQLTTKQTRSHFNERVSKNERFTRKT